MSVETPFSIPIYPMPPSITIPYAKYFSPIKWSNGYEKWSLVRFSTPMDGNCLFHSILNAFFAPYHTQELKGDKVPRIKMVQSLRLELAEKLESLEKNGKNYYENLNNGNTSLFADAVPEFKLDYMKAQLNSNLPIGYGYMEYIGNILNKDIYILEAIRWDIYITDELPLTIKGNRSAIILYYMNGHYELVGVDNDDGTFTVHFAPEHSLIKFLYERVKQIISAE